MQIISISLIGQMITFALFIWFTMHFVWPPLTKVMQARQKKIADGIASADKAEKDLEIAQFKAKEIVEGAKEQASVIIEKANQRSHRIKEEAAEEGRNIMARMRKSAEEDIAQQTLEVRAQLQAEVGNVALDVAEKLLMANMDSAKNQKILAQLLTEVKAI